VDRIADDPLDTALEYARTCLLPHSASSLRHAVRAARTATGPRFLENLARVERQYLSELMCTHDAVEGLRAFLDKRDPEWEDR
jgi:cyclohexa-1,5-dienecarbonyl-CoA hydratase